MKPNTLFRWFFSKLSFVTVLLTVAISWWVSSLEYQKEFSLLKTNLLKLALEIDKGKSLSEVTSDDLTYSIVNESGEIVLDKTFGSLSSIADSEFFLKTISGEVTVRTVAIESSQKVECWSAVNYNDAKHVLILRKDFSRSKSVYFFINFSLIFILAMIVLAFYSLIITNPISDAMTYMTSEISSLQKEKYEKKQPSIDTEEFASLYNAYNKLSSHIQSELTSLRTDVNQWEVFFSTMPRGLLAIDSERIIHNCNANALNLMDVKEQVNSEVLGSSIMSVFRNADLNRITSDFFTSNKFLEEYEFELVANNIVETIKVICVELEMNEGDEPSKGAIVIIENITSLRRLENMRKSSLQ